MAWESDLPPVFQHWQTTSAPASVSFGAGASEDIPALWSLDLPAAPGEAEQTLTDAERQLQSAQRLLEAAPERLESFVAHLDAGEAPHFALEALPERAAGEKTAEAGLLTWIDAFQPEGVSFGGPGLAQIEIGEAVSRFQQMVNNLEGQLLHLAQVETRLEGHLLARSLVSWKADLDTSWEDAASEKLRRLHERSLKLALASRLTLLKMLVTATQGATKIAVLIAAPGGALLALPAVWKYLNTLISQVKEL